MLVHQDAEIVEPDFCEIVRGPLEDPDTGLIGCVGAVGRAQYRVVGGVGDVRLVHQPLRGARGRRSGVRFSWAWTEAPAYARIGQVETLDGFVLVLSPWVVRNIRFDETLGHVSRL